MPPPTTTTTSTTTTPSRDGFHSLCIGDCVEAWETELADDPIDRNFILTGIAEGFHITDPGSKFSPAEHSNYKSATETYKDLAEEQIYKEIELGRYVIVPDKPTIVSSLGAVPKSTPNSIRLIHDCSRPLGKGLNSYASTETFKYATLDHATSLLPMNGYMSKVDLKSAFRSVPIHEDSQHATGLQWTFTGNTRTTYMKDTRLPFGASRSCFIFQKLSNAVVRIMSRRGYTVVAYLDDFLVLESTRERCQAAHDTLLQLLQRLGFSINFDKVVGPCQTLTFLGVEVSSVDRTLSLPLDKLHKLQDLLQDWQSKTKVTKRALQQLIGKLNWAARVIRGGRTFLRRLIDLSCKLQCAHHRSRLTASARADIAWWSEYMSVFNGTVGFIDSIPVPSDLFSTDACSEGGGGFYGKDWFYVNWAASYPAHSQAHINIKELLTVGIAAERWAKSWSNSHIVVLTDNTTTMYAINKGTSHCSTMMLILRRLFWLSAVHNFHLTARYIRGADNVVSDCLSRLHDRSHMWTACTLFPQDCYMSLNYCSLNMYGHTPYTSFAWLQDLYRLTSPSSNRRLPAKVATWGYQPCR